MTEKPEFLEGVTHEIPQPVINVTVDVITFFETFLSGHPPLSTEAKILLTGYLHGSLSRNCEEL